MHDQSSFNHKYLIYFTAIIAIFAILVVIFTDLFLVKEIRLTGISKEREGAVIGAINSNINKHKYSILKSKILFIRSSDFDFLNQETVPEYRESSINLCGINCIYVHIDTFKPLFRQGENTYYNEMGGVYTDLAFYHDIPTLSYSSKPLFEPAKFINLNRNISTTSLSTSSSALLGIASSTLNEISITGSSSSMSSTSSTATLESTSIANEVREVNENKVKKLSGEDLVLLSETLKRLDKLGIRVLNISIDLHGDMQFKTTNSLIIRYNVKNGIENLFTKLGSLKQLEKVNNAFVLEKSSLEYIDLRYGNKAFYKESKETETETRIDDPSTLTSSTTVTTQRSEIRAVREGQE